MRYIDVDLVKLAPDSQHQRIDARRTGRRGRRAENAHDGIVLSGDGRVHAHVLHCDRKQALHARLILRLLLGLLICRLRRLWRFNDADVTIAGPWYGVLCSEDDEGSSRHDSYNEQSDK